MTARCNTSCSLYRKGSEYLSVLGRIGVYVNPGRRITLDKQSRDKGKIKACQPWYFAFLCFFIALQCEESFGIEHDGLE